MAYTISKSLALGTSKAGIADLRAQIFDTAGSAVGSAITTGFLDRGSGNYLWSGSIPDGHRGGIDFYSAAAPSDILAVVGINPEDAENVDAKVSSRSTFDHTTNSVDVGSVGGETVNPTTQDGTANGDDGTNTITLSADEPADSLAWQAGDEIRFHASGEIGTVSAWNPNTKQVTFSPVLDQTLSTAGGLVYSLYRNADGGGGGGGDATAANQTTIIDHLTDMKGVGWTTTDTLEAIKDDKTGYELSATGVAAIWTPTLTQDYAADGAEGTPSQILYGIQQAIQQFSIAGLITTVYELDGTTVAFTLTHDSATAATYAKRNDV